MSDTFSERFTNAVNLGGQFTVQVNGRRRMPSSGIVYKSNLIITANHTVEREDDITVAFSGEKTFSARIAGRDPARDLVLLRLSEGSASPASVSEVTPNIGLPALAVARPDASSLEASFGIIRAIGGPVRTGRGGMLEKYLRAEVNPYPGFSGGPLIDLDGNLLGMNTSGFSMGSLVTIPVDIIWKMAANLAEHGSVRRGYLGIRSQPVNLSDANQSVLNRTQENGLLLVGIEAGSPAASAGLIVGDILVSIEGQPVSSHDTLQSHLSSDLVGKSITVGILRGGQSHDVTVTVGEGK
ncbi:MAG TPA: trypsin-like peptidase domain-containing protein [Anaerolineaceae bacterium]|nr:trypsin-like peptidase domain-containing protein [Anaerolineaceae bacterium]